MQSWWYLAAATRGASIQAPGGRLMSWWMFPGFYGNSWLSRLTMRIQLIRCISHIQSLIFRHLSSWVNARTHNNDRLASTLCCPFLVRTAGSFSSQLFLPLFHCPWLNSNLRTHATLYCKIMIPIKPSAILQLSTHPLRHASHTTRTRVSVRNTD